MYVLICITVKSVFLIAPDNSRKLKCLLKLINLKLLKEIYMQCVIKLTLILQEKGELSLRKYCLYSELFWFAFSRTRTEYRTILCISPYSVQMRENANQNNSEYGHLLRRVYYCQTYKEIKDLINETCQGSNK